MVTGVLGIHGAPVLLPVAVSLELLPEKELATIQPLPTSVLTVLDQELKLSPARGHQIHALVGKNRFYVMSKNSFKFIK